jgi:hypothetical protein
MSLTRMSENDNKENIDGIFSECGLPIPVIVYNLAQEKRTSFNICKSNGYKIWKKAQSS